MSTAPKSLFVKTGNTYSITSSANLNVQETLPAATYSVMFNQDRGFYLSEMDAVGLPEKIYGNLITNADRMFNTFLERERATGVLLNGEKGSGKTLTLATLAHKCIAHGMPVLFVNSEFAGESFNKFINDLAIPCMVAFDEFDKVYRKEVQEHILTLLDGVYDGKKLFVITCNDDGKLSQFLLNRPGRMYYNVKYEGMDEQAIREYCADKLNDKKQIDSVYSLTQMFWRFNFDMLKALVEEMNRYKEPAKEAVKLLNIKGSVSMPDLFSLVVFKDGEKVYADPSFGINPLMPFSVHWANEKSGDEWDDFSIYLTTQEITAMKNGGYTFKKDGYTIELSKKKKQQFDAFSYLD